MELAWLAVVLQLVFLEGILSLDNAAVLGAMVASLPADRAVPWPPVLRPLGCRLEPLLGMQREAALKVGLLGAYLGRGLMLFVAHVVIQNHWLQLFGGGYLVYLALSYFAQPDLSSLASERLSPSNILKGNFWTVVLAVELADLAFSLDNVVAAVALSNHFLVLLLGVALGILALRFAARIFTVLIEREPILEPTAYVLVLVIGIRFFLERLLGFDMSPVAQFGVSLAVLLFALLYAHWPPLQALRPLLQLSHRIVRVSGGITRKIVIQPVGALGHLLLTTWSER